MTNLEGLVDEVSGQVSASIFFDFELYAIERDRVFGRSWLYLAHESQIPSPGDFTLAYMGEDSVVVARQTDGSVAAFLNQCRHRGARICRADLGKQKFFTCTYHGWTYDGAGRLVSVPGEVDAYNGTIDKAANGARPVTQVFNHRGFIFGNWDATAPSFVDWLGDFAWYFDGLLDPWPGGTEVLGGVHKWTIRANWKFAAEQFASDNYHGAVSHASAWMALRGIDKDAPAPSGGRAVTTVGRQFASSHGHGTGFATEPRPDFAGPAVSTFRREHENEMTARLGTERLALIQQSHANIFPNFAILTGAQSIRVWHPRGPNEMEIWAWSLVPKAASTEAKAGWRKTMLRTFSPGGIFEQDDGENWAEVQKTLRGHAGRAASFNISMGLGATAHDAGGFPGTTGGYISEEAARRFYGRWADLMSGADWAELDRRALQRERLPEAAE